MTNAPLTCRELVELLTEYLDGTLAARSRVRLEAHLSECDACREYVAQFRATIAVAGTLHEDALSAPQRAELEGAFRSFRRPRWRRLLRLRP